MNTKKVVKLLFNHLNSKTTDLNAKDIHERTQCYEN